MGLDSKLGVERAKGFAEWSAILNVGVDPGEDEVATTPRRILLGNVKGIY